MFATSCYYILKITKTAIYLLQFHLLFQQAFIYYCNFLLLIANKTEAINLIHKKKKKKRKRETIEIKKKVKPIYQ